MRADSVSPGMNTNASSDNKPITIGENLVLKWLTVFEEFNQSDCSICITIVYF